MKTRTPKLVSWETHLVRRAALGETVAFELLADLYRPTLYSLAVRMLRNADDAKDAVQESLLRRFALLAISTQPARFGPGYAGSAPTVAST